jgi:hypothetical protein
MEWRGIVELTGRASLPLDILGALRNRFDLRWLDDGYSTRYRIRLSLEKEMDVIPGWTIVPYVSAEPFYDSRFAAWSRVQYKAGITFPVIALLAIEGYYLRQDDWRSQPAHINAFGLVAILYF